MKIVVTGNMGYVGPLVLRRLRESHRGIELVGYDSGFFAHCLTGAQRFPESRADIQHFGDIRQVPEEVLRGADAVVHLCAISNDPMGALFEEVTLDINYRASLDLAAKAKRVGVKAFVFASSCSVYGFAEGGPRREEDALNPLTAYAKSKVFTERDLASLASDSFTVTCLRFATACGMSDRLRLDLVLNDFVAGALVSQRINILSDGTPWRPLIHVKDMARAIDWAIQRDHRDGGKYLTVNVGSDEWNYQVKDLAAAVAKLVPNVEVSVNKDAQPDKRSYRVNFDKFTKLGQGFLPSVDLQGAVVDLRDGLMTMQFRDPEFRSGEFMRLVTLRRLREVGQLSDNLMWKDRS
ncbi:NAD-dependent epimerase/dehydratase [Nitrospira sp. KM1]|uniref:NAD-dependent epimerase/dehydratase family protein n=1 Tax=Nitrospira sp. KM1 TaxID=1936990 RepID=UPI0013A761E7|nr:SDR family oxidoreductase [Nitrospira sp. KM1]BCA54137.1 NAD-dependent epimerase/dehydratase [Nitrospira sp. KM1]